MGTYPNVVTPAPHTLGSVSGFAQPVVEAIQGLDTRVLAVETEANATVFAKKTADTSRASNSVLTADPHLLVSLAANSTYEVEILLSVNALAGADFKQGWSIPSGGTQEGWQYHYHSAASTISFSRTSSVTNVVGNSTDRPLRAKGLIIMGATSGLLAVTWAQQVSNATATILRSGSFMIARKVA